MEVAAVLVGAGQGERLRASLVAAAATPSAAQAPPKAFVPLLGRPLLAWALEALAACPEIEAIVPVVAASDRERADALAAGLAGCHKLRPAVAGGAARQDSVRCGLEALPEAVAFVAVHDAARPLVRPQDVSRVVAAARRHGAALLAVPVTDTLKQVREGIVCATPVRAEYWAAQTPQVFRVDWLREALAKASAEGSVATDCAALVEALGVAVHVVEGDPENLKITTARDLEIAALLQRRRSAGGEA